MLAKVGWLGSRGGIRQERSRQSCWRKQSCCCWDHEWIPLLLVLLLALLLVLVLLLVLQLVLLLVVQLLLLVEHAAED
jgi:hypothetical protein